MPGTMMKSGLPRRGRSETPQAQQSRGQRAIVEHVLLLAATFSMLVTVSLLFSALNSKVAEFQIRDSLNSLSEQTSIAIVQAYEAGRQTSPQGQPPVRVVLNSFPQTIAGREYTIFYQANEKSIIAVSKADRVKVRVPVPIPVEGTLYSSFGQRASVSYFSAPGYCFDSPPPCLRLEMV